MREQNGCNKAQIFFHSEHLSFTGETGANVIVLLFILQNATDLYCGDGSSFILGAETHCGDLSISIGTGYHLYWNIYTKDAFHVHQLLSL